jgi:hypothetical protein
MPALQPGLGRFPAWSPVWETHSAVRLLIHPAGRPYYRSWHARVAPAPPARLHGTSPVNLQRGSIPDFLTPAATAAEIR